MGNFNGLSPKAQQDAEMLFADEVPQKKQAMLDERALWRAKSIQNEGKRVKIGDWVYGAYTPYCRAGSADFKFGNPDGTYPAIYVSDELGARFIRVDPDTLGQCTGLRDKNGTLIFEGDILQEDRNPTPFIYQVDWINGNGAFIVCVRGNDGKISGCCGMEMSYNMRVIGNIHDNPELLERSDTT